jgi:hypothetical protein
VTIDNSPVPNILGYLDAPSPGSMLSGNVNVVGWGLQTQGHHLLFTLSIDGNSFYSGQQAYVERPDVCRAFGQISACGAAPRGVVVPMDTRNISDGVHDLGLWAIDADVPPNQTTPYLIGHESITVRNQDGILAGYVDSPGADAEIRGTLQIAGWVFSRAGAPVQLKFVLDGYSSIPAQFVTIQRPDVCQAFPNVSSCLTSGFVARIDASAINGTASRTHHTIGIFVTDSSGTRSDVIGARGIWINN